MNFQEIKPLLKGKEVEIHLAWEKSKTSGIDEFKQVVTGILNSNGIITPPLKSNTCNAVLFHCEKVAYRKGIV